MNFLPAYRPSRLLPVLSAAAAVITALVLIVSQPVHAATARTATGRAAAVASGAKPTIVLVHGAWADGASWAAVAKRLQRLGYTVDIPPNTLRGVPQDSAYLKDFLSAVSGPIVLAGHSYGGTVITNAATGNRHVKALVYVDAYLPAQGEMLEQLNNAKPGSCISSSVLNTAPYPGAPSGDFDTYVKQSWFPGCFANGLPAAEGAELAAEQRPLAASTFTEPSGIPAWKTIPSWDVVGTADRVLVPAEQLVMAKRAHARITKIRAPHLSMVSEPGVVTSVILKAVHATR